MFKNILITGLLCTFLSAESFSQIPMGFDEFLRNAITNSPYLESSALAVKQAKQSGNILRRYENPTLELEYSNFVPDVGSSDNGYRVNYSQPIRLWGVGNAKDALAREMTNSANAEFFQKKAIFVRDISIAFAAYAEQKMFLNLGDEELEIAKTIYDISKARYESGTISRGVMLQAEIDYESVQIANESLALATNQSYYNLLSFAGINEEITLDTSYTFVHVSLNDNANNPTIKLLKSQQNMALSHAKINENTLEWINVFAEYESEPDQDITRVGVNFPLAFFDTKSEEKRIASLQASRSQLLIDHESKGLEIEVSRVQKERTSLEKLRLKNEEIIKSEIELLTMFQNGYKISNTNLLQLQDIKNRVISTKRNLIKINSALNKNAIISNYNQGLYND